MTEECGPVPQINSSELGHCPRVLKFVVGVWVMIFAVSFLPSLVVRMVAISKLARPDR